MAKTRSADRRRHWRKLIERQRGSGQSIVAFCAQQKLNPASFHAWKRRLFGGEAETGKTVARQALVPVQIVGDPAGGGGTLEVEWPSGVVLRAQGCEAATIGAVVSALTASSKRGSRRC